MTNHNTEDRPGQAGNPTSACSEPEAGPDTASLVELDRATCLALLRSVDIGRLGVNSDDGGPIVLPVSHVVIDVDERPMIAIRTRPGNVLDRPDHLACFEVDGIDPGHDGGWSVLVRGALRSAQPTSSIDSHPLLAVERDAWLILEPSSITGRRLVAPPARWAFHPRAYV